MTFKTFYLFLLLPVLFLTGCSDNTVSSDSSVSGRFTDESGQAVEGALVRVFAVKPLDTLVTRLRKEYKDVGCDISDATEFDHRFYGKALAEGNTKSDGSFSVKGLSGGPYHISITHPQYSWRYIYRTNGNPGDVKTKPVKEISGVLIGNTVWDDAGQDYIITGNTTQNGGSLTIKSGVRVRLGSQRKLTVQNVTLSIQGEVLNPVWITSDTDSNETRFSSGLQINSSSAQVSGVIVSGSTNGLTCRDITNGIISNSVFKNNYIGLYLVQFSNTLTINNSNLKLNDENSILAETISGKLVSCIVANNEKTAIQLSQASNLQMEDCFISGKASAIHSETNSSADITTSEIQSAASPVLTSRGSSVSIQRSNLTGANAIIALRSGEPIPLQTITVSESNFFTPPNVSVIEVYANLALTLTKVYFKEIHTIQEYDNAIVYGYGDSKSKIVIEPKFSPVTNAGITK